jgi:hypothetical protein
MVRRTAETALAADGSLKGTITARFEGGEALERRLEALTTDEAGKRESLEAEAKDWLPPGALVKLTASDGWEGSEGPLVATFAVELPAYASVAGRKLLVPTDVFQSRQMDTFKHAERKYPVYFPYAFGEADRIVIRGLPDYTAETVPMQQSSSLSYATYLNESRFDGKQLVTDRVLQVNGIFFKPESYGEIKDFFRKVQLGDEQQAVFHSSDRAGGIASLSYTRP